MTTVDLLQDLVLIPGPPGQEGGVARHLQGQLTRESHIDPKGNLLVPFGSKSPKVIVTAHMDEIAMMVTQVLDNGSLRVKSLGGLYPWKLGEGPVMILATNGSIDGVLSFGSIHTEDKGSTVEQFKQKPVDWESTFVLTGLSRQRLTDLGVRPGTRVVVHPKRRGLTQLGDLIGGYFLDDRADLVSWLLAINHLKDFNDDVLFAATTSEEVGGEGARYLLHQYQPEVCIALELGPNVPDAPLLINDQPTVWASDSYATMSATDGDLLTKVGDDLGLKLQFQALSRGGSDASSSANLGLCARPITLGLPMDNSHGYEVMHPGAMDNLANLTCEVVRRLLS